MLNTLVDSPRIDASLLKASIELIEERLHDTTDDFEIVLCVDYAIDLLLIKRRVFKELGAPSFVHSSQKCKFTTGVSSVTIEFRSRAEWVQKNPNDICYYVGIHTSQSFGDKFYRFPDEIVELWKLCHVSISDIKDVIKPSDTNVLARLF